MRERLIHSWDFRKNCLWNHVEVTEYLKSKFTTWLQFFEWNKLCDSSIFPCQLGDAIFSLFQLVTILTRREKSCYSYWDAIFVQIATNWVLELRSLLLSTVSREKQIQLHEIKRKHALICCSFRSCVSIWSSIFELCLFTHNTDYKLHAIFYNQQVPGERFFLSNFGILLHLIAIRLEATS